MIWSAPAERSDDGAFDGFAVVPLDAGNLERSKAPSSLRSAGALQMEMIEIVNRQRSRRVEKEKWREFGERALGAIGSAKRDATVVFVSDRNIKKLNRRFRGKSLATDVLSFPTKAEPFEAENRKHVGDVVISVQRAAAQAKAKGLSFSREIEQLILHGLLHLCGYDHESDKGEMNRLELKLRRKLEI